MGNHPSAMADDGESPIHRQSYTVCGPLHARSITASTINAGTIHARRITCQSAHISSRQLLDRQDYPDPPHRAITAHTLSADVIYADEVNCKTLRCYDIHVGGGQQWNANRTEWLDRDKARWDGKEDVDSEPSDDETDQEHAANADRARRKNLTKMGLAGAAAVGIGGAAFAYLKHRMDEKGQDEKRKRAEGENEKMETEHRDEDKEKEDGKLGRQHDDRQRRDDDVGHRKEDERDKSQQQQQQQQQLLLLLQQQQDEHATHHSRGDYHLSSRKARLWSDGNHCFLVADCGCDNGRFQESRIDLDDIISNADGQFRWARQGQAGNFSGTAQRWEILEQGNTMAADLQSIDGSWHRSRLDLAECIKNENGHLKYIK